MKAYKLKINGNDYSVSIKEMEDNTASVEVNGTRYKVEMDKPLLSSNKTPRVVQVSVAPPTGDNQPVKTSAPNSVGAVKSPLPGVILEINVKEGDTVKVGQKLLMLEAMKMENTIESDRDGKVVSVKVTKGESVLEGADLVIIG